MHNDLAVTRHCVRNHAFGQVEEERKLPVKLLLFVPILASKGVPRLQALEAISKRRALAELRGELKLVQLLVEARLDAGRRRILIRMVIQIRQGKLDGSLVVAAATLEPADQRHELFHQLHVCVRVCACERELMCVCVCVCVC